MSRFRIVQRPSWADPTEACFYVEKRIWWSWRLICYAWTIEKAEQGLFDAANKGRNNQVETKVIEEYDL